MSVKSKITMLAIIMYLSLICVGFASWSISVDSNDAVTSGDVISTESVINTSDAITVISTESFRYFNNGFISDEDTLVYSANIRVTISIDKSKCEEATAEIKLNQDVIGLGFDSISSVIEGSSDTTTYESKVTIDVSKINTDEITIVFTLNSNKDDFTSKVFEPIYTYGKTMNIFNIELNVTKEKSE